jgi:peptidyl-prolyl cis-trans isomerase C
MQNKELRMTLASARHILVPTREACEALKARIEAGEDFADCARENSRCPSGRDGGNLGQFGPGQMVTEFDTVVFSGEVGTVLGPVQTQFGYHLIEVTQRSE